MKKTHLKCLLRDGHCLRSGLQSLLCILILLAGGSTHSLVIDVGDGKGNTSVPDPDPGWSSVAQHLGGPSSVYLGCGWMITTAHVGVTIVVIEGKRYDPVAGSITPIVNEDGTETDLVLFQIDGDPGLDPLKIPTRSLKLGQEVLMIGFGLSRGPSLTVNLSNQMLEDGFVWAEDSTKRWGTNRISSMAQLIKESGSETMAVAMVFDRLGWPGSTDQESSAARGDSGGGVFAPLNPVFPEWGWGLAGLIFSVSHFGVQPQDTSLYGNVTWVADLAVYRDQIGRVVWAPPGPESPAEEPLQAVCARSDSVVEESRFSKRTLAGAAAVLVAAIGLIQVYRRSQARLQKENQIER